MALNVSSVPKAIITLSIFALALLVLGGIIARTGRAAQSAVSAVV